MELEGSTISISKFSYSMSQIALSLITLKTDLLAKEMMLFISLTSEKVLRLRQEARIRAVEAVVVVSVGCHSLLFCLYFADASKTKPLN
jgi:hypothetical protein